MIDLGRIKAYGTAKTRAAWLTNPIRTVLWRLIAPYFQGFAAEFTQFQRKEVQAAFAMHSDRLHSTSLQDPDLLNQESCYLWVSYSTEAEDLLVDRVFYDLLGNPRDLPGFYVDIGAHDPTRSSNTYRFYKLGWRGINIEPNPDAMPRFAAIRPRDITLNVAVGPDGMSDEYVSFDEPLLNGFLTPAIVQHHLTNGRSLLGRRRILFRALNSILAENVPSSVSIDFLNIDVELMEYAILSDFDFVRWHPQVIAVEIHGALDVSSIVQTDVAQLLSKNGYSHVSRLWHTSIFARPKVS